MAASPCVLAIDQGTTSSRAIVFDVTGQRVSVAQAEYPQLIPGRLASMTPAAIWQTTLQTARDAPRAAEDSGHTVVALGITNQRETVVLWDRRPGRPLGNAIVWQDRRTAAECSGWRLPDTSPRSRRAPACCSTRIFQPPRSPGCWTTSPVPANAPGWGSSLAARSTVSLSGS